MNLSKANWVVIFLAIIYAVGVWGLNSTSWQSLFRSVTPVNLSLTAFLLIFFHEGHNNRIGTFALLCMLLGYSVEVLGVQTGFPFGVYEYHTTLGIKLLDTPLMIGVNWLILTYACGMIAQRFFIPSWKKALLGAALMVIIDFVIEPFAIYHQLWSWEGGSIPIQNYAAWYVIAFVLLLLFYRLVPPSRNPLVLPIYLLLFIFFAINNLFIP